MNLRSVLHNVKTAVVLIVQLLLYIHQRKHFSKVQNPFKQLDFCYFNLDLHVLYPTTPGKGYNHTPLEILDDVSQLLSS